MSQDFHGHVTRSSACWLPQKLMDGLSLSMAGIDCKTGEPGKYAFEEHIASIEVQSERSAEQPLTQGFSRVRRGRLDADPLRRWLRVKRFCLWAIFSAGHTIFLLRDDKIYCNNV